MDDLFVHQFWRALQFQLPCITAYLIGIALVLYYRRRFPVPCLYVFLGCCVKMTNAVYYSAAAVLLARQGDFASLETVETAVGVIDALGYGLFFLAVFQGRKPLPRPSPWQDDWDEDVDRPPAPRDSTDIQGR